MATVGWRRDAGRCDACGTAFVKARPDDCRTAADRGWMGVEPTSAGYTPPLTGFEDRGGHRAPYTPTESNTVVARRCAAVNVARA